MRTTQKAFLLFGCAMLTFGFANRSTAQRSIGAGSLILDDFSGHSITVGTPRSGSAAWTAWQNAGFPSLQWTAPIPPSQGAQAGFVFSGPLSGAINPILMPYWLPLNTTSLIGNGNRGGAAGAWDYANKAQLGIVSGAGSPTFIPLWNADGVSIGTSHMKDDGSQITSSEPIEVHLTGPQTIGTALNSNTTFIQFRGGDNNIRGSITGQDASDLTSDPIYQSNKRMMIANTVLAGVNVLIGIGNAVDIGNPFDLPTAVLGTLEAASAAAGGIDGCVEWFIQDGILHDNLGVSYSSQAGDYAEYLKRADTAERLYPGDIVGVKNGRISRSTKDAQNVFSISLAPMVLGNVPPKAEASSYNKVAFLGQVPVKVRGEVTSGDFIIPSGLEDGTGIAVSPDTITAEQFTTVVGRAWTSSHMMGIKYVKVAVGLNAKAISEIVSREQQEIEGLKRRIATLESSHNEIAMIKAELQRLNKKLSGTGNSVRTARYGNN